MQATNTKQLFIPKWNHKSAAKSLNERKGEEVKQTYEKQQHTKFQQL